MTVLEILAVIWGTSLIAVLPMIWDALRNDGAVRGIDGQGPARDRPASQGIPPNSR